MRLGEVPFRSDGRIERELPRRHERTGRPLGGQRFIDKLDRIVGRKLRPQELGRSQTNEN